jgi:imidazolonepropionase-like amidohydrolase
MKRGLQIAALALFSCAVSCAQSATEPNRRLALIGGLIYTDPAAAPIRDGVILIQNGKISAVGRRGSVVIPAGTRTIDCKALTITAGFWNSHVHFLERKWANAGKIPASELTAQLEEMLTRYGFTSVFDTWSPWENTRRLRERIESGEVPGPRIRTTGEALVPKGSTPPPLVADIQGFTRYSVPEVSDEAEAVTASVKLLDQGVDGIKMYARTFGEPIASMPESAMRAATTQAHRRGKPAFAHPTDRDGLLAAVRAGVDVIVHTTPQSGPWDEMVVAAMKQRNVALIPTLQLWRYETRHERLSVRERFVENSVGQLRAWAAAGGAVLFGTDVGYMADYNPAEEYDLMARAGMDFKQILSSLTTAPATQFSANPGGRVAVGLPADLVVLNRNPAHDVRAFVNVRYTIRNGNMIYMQK